MFIHLDIFLFFFLALVEEPLTGFSKVIIIQGKGSFALIAGEITTETVIELLDVLFVDFFVVLISLSIQRELVKYNLQYFLIVLILLLLCCRRRLLILLRLLLLFIIFLVLSCFLFFRRLLLLFRLSLNYLFWLITLLYFDPASKVEKIVSIS